MLLMGKKKRIREGMYNSNNKCPKAYGKYVILLNLMNIL